MNLHKHVTEKTNTDRNRFSRYCMKAAAGALTLVMIGGCVPAVNPLYSQNGGWTIEASAAEPMAISLEDGVYAVNGTMQKPDGTSSMSDGAIAHAIKLTVQEGEYYLTMNFKGLNVAGLRGYFSNLKYYNTGYTVGANGNPTGDLTDVTVESVQKYTDGEILSDSLGTNYPDIVTFPLIPEALTDGRVPLQVFVPIMEELSAGSGTQNVYLVLDWDSVSKTTADDAVFAEGDVIDEKPSQTPEEDDQNPGGNQGNEEKPSKDPDEGDQNNKPFGNTQNPGSDAGQNQNNQNQSDQNTAPKPGGAQAAALTAGATYTAGGNTYQATSGGTVTVKTVANKKSVNIPATVTVGGVKAKVTAIGNNAFKKAKKKLTKVTIGANVTSIGKKTFAGCKKLKKITIKSKKLASVGAKAFKGISKNATIKTPKAKKKAYAKLLKNKGQAKSVKIR